MGFVNPVRDRCGRPYLDDDRTRARRTPAAKSLRFLLGEQQPNAQKTRCADPLLQVPSGVLVNGCGDPLEQCRAKAPLLPEQGNVDDRAGVELDQAGVSWGSL